MTRTPSRAEARKPDATAALRIHATLDVLSEVDHSLRPLDAITSAFFRSQRQLADADKGAILDRVYAVLRHRARLGWWLGRSSHPDTPRNRVLAWLALAERQTPDQARRLIVPLTEAELSLLGQLQGGTMDHPEMQEDIRLECPPWAEGPLRRRFGESFAREMDATLTPPPLDLRVNPMRTSRASVLRELKGLGIPAEPTPFAPQGIRIADRLSLSRLPGLKSGEIEIQDEGSQLVALLLDAQPGEQVVDFCAGAGGKTLAIAAQMLNRGHIVACDISESRLKRCAERLRRAGLQNTETRLLASETDRWIKRHKARFDRVLVDAPCSGTGTWRRNPDARWRAPELGLPALVALQSRILASAARLVKPGGRLVYATCSMLWDENEKQVTEFLTLHPDFTAIALRDTGIRLPHSANPDYLSLTPARHGTDGFFAAMLQRRAEPSATSD